MQSAYLVKKNPYKFILIFARFRYTPIMLIKNLMRTLGRAVVPVILLSLASCAGLQKEKDLSGQNQELERAKQDYLERTEAFNKEVRLDLPEQSPRRQLIQFTYGPETLGNNEFLQYLIATNAVLPSSLIDQMNRYEDNYIADLSKSGATNSNAVSNLLKDLNRKVNLYTKLAKSQQMSFSSTPVKVALNQLTKNTGIRVKVDETVSMNLSGQYSGSIATILDNIAADNNLYILVSNNYRTLTLSSQRPEDAELFDLSFTKEITNINEDSDLIRQYLARSGANDQALDLAVVELKSNLIRDFVANYNKKIRTNQDIDKSARESSAMRKQLVKRSLAATKNQEVTSTIAIFDPEITNGKEKVIERFSVYNDTPSSMKAKLEKYPMFTCGQEEAAAKEAAPVTAEVSAEMTATPTQPEAVQPSATTLFEPTTESGCVKFSDDNSGIVATGSIVDVKLIEKVLVSQDTPVRQAMIEAYILEVSTNWKTTLESKIQQERTRDGDPGLWSFAAGVLDATAAATEAGVTLGMGKADELRLLVNFLETNKIGKKVANPVILVKDGETGVVEQRKVFRFQETGSTINANNAQATTTIKEIEAPIRLTITPEINEHNDEIDLGFSYTAEYFETADPLASSTENTINSKLKVKPGQIIMMAGLFQEQTSKQETGIPGLTDMITTPLKYLFGFGGKVDTIEGSELLVFLNPVVITNKNMAKTLPRKRLSSDKPE